MSFTLLKTTTRQNGLLFIIFFSVLTMYLGVMVAMFDPDSMAYLASMLELFPEDLMKAMGFSSIITNLTDYLASWLYGLLMFGFPMVYCIILGNRLVAKMVDNSSFAYLLSTPNSRAKIILTQGIYALGSVLVLFAALFGVGVLFCSLAFPGLLDINGFFQLNITTMLVNMTVITISFFFSCLFNDTKLSLAFGSGIPITFLLMNMMGGVSEQTEILKQLSIYGIYDPVELVHAGGFQSVNFLYLASIAILFVASIMIFKRKQLPL